MKIGIAGFGFMGATHFRAFAGMANVGVTAISSRRPLPNAQQMAGNLGRQSAPPDLTGVRILPNWQELLSDRTLDAIDICLPTDMHAAVSLAALTAGKHVLCEKPMALKTVECEQILAAVHAHNRIFMVGQVLRFWPEYKYLYDFVKRRPYGRILSARFIRQCGVPAWSPWLSDETRSGGAILDLLVHDIDQTLSLFGVPSYVAGMSSGDVDTLSASLIYADGFKVQIQGGWLNPGAPFFMGFHVRAQHATLELGENGFVIKKNNGENETLSMDKHDAYEEQGSYFVQCCRGNTPPQLCPAEDSAQAVKLALLLKQSRALRGQQLEFL